MADTVTTYLPDIKCMDCKQEIVTIIHTGSLLKKGENTAYLCNECFKKRSA